MNKKSITLCLLACLLLAGCKDDPSAPTQGAGERPVDVAVRHVQPQRITMTTELAGRVSAFQVSEVRPQVSGIIQKRFFREGSDVQEGEVLYQIDPATYQAALDSARASLVRAEANVLPARLKMNRFKDLVNISAVSKQEYEDAEAAWKQAVADVTANRAAVENAQIRLNYTRVTAPISGRISRSQVTPGALVTENQAAPLATVHQLDPVYVDVTQSSTDQLAMRRAIDSGRIQRIDDSHAPVRLMLEDGTSYEASGSLQFSEVSVDESTGSVTVRALFPNPRHLLLPGMYVRAVLDEGVAEQAILVPQEALVRDPRGNATVYLVNDKGRMEVRPITVGRTWKGHWIVQEGLNAGDTIIVEGLQKVRPGSLLHPVETPAVGR